MKQQQPNKLQKVEQNTHHSFNFVRHDIHALAEQIRIQQQVILQLQAQVYDLSLQLSQQQLKQIAHVRREQTPRLERF